MGAYFTLTADFYANNTNGTTERAASLTFNDTEFTFSAIVANMNLSMDIVTINVDKITANYCSWGKIHTAPDKIAINNAIRALLPSIDKKLANVTVSIPDHLGKYFLLSDAVLS